MQKIIGLCSFWASLVSILNCQGNSLCMCQTGWLLSHLWWMDTHSSPCLKSYYCFVLFCICVTSDNYWNIHSILKASSTFYISIWIFLGGAIQIVLSKIICLQRPSSLPFSQTHGCFPGPQRGATIRQVAEIISIFFPPLSLALT